jgi:hypothetical protein
MQVLDDSMPIKRVMYYDEAEDRLIVKGTQDIEPILRWTHELRSLGQRGNETKLHKHVAEIPLVVAEQWLKEGLNIFDKNCEKDLKRKLNDPDNKFFRVWQGRI